jgi:hypothetical protein
VRIGSSGATVPDDLATAAIVALPKIAAAAGHPIPAVKPAPAKGGGGGGGGTPAWVFVIPLFLVALAGALTMRRSRGGVEPT